MGTGVVWVMLLGLIIAAVVWVGGYHTGGQQGYDEGSKIKTAETFMDGYRTGYEVGYQNGLTDGFRKAVRQAAGKEEPEETPERS